MVIKAETRCKVCEEKVDCWLDIVVCAQCYKDIYTDLKNISKDEGFWVGKDEDEPEWLREDNEDE